MCTIILDEGGSLCLSGVCYASMNPWDVICFIAYLDAGHFPDFFFVFFVALVVFVSSASISHCSAAAVTSTAVNDLDFLVWATRTMIISEVTVDSSATKRIR